MWYCATSCYIRLCHVTLTYIKSKYIKYFKCSNHIIWRYVISCYILSHHVLSYHHVIWYHIIYIISYCILFYHLYYTRLYYVTGNRIVPQNHADLRQPQPTHHPPPSRTVVGLISRPHRPTSDWPSQEVRKKGSGSKIKNLSQHILKSILRSKWKKKHFCY